MGVLSTGGRTISWRPFGTSTVAGIPSTVNILNNLPLLTPGSDPGILVRLTLKGNFIWARADPKLYLDGKPSGFRLPGGNTTDIHSPSGGGHPGSDFEMWFWLTYPLYGYPCPYPYGYYGGEMGIGGDLI